jgi:hypothetical protein
MEGKMMMDQEYRQSQRRLYRVADKTREQLAGWWKKLDRGEPLGDISMELYLLIEEIDEAMGQKEPQ